MKKYFAYVLTVLALCGILSGCGNNNAEDDKVFESPIIDMENNIKDGIVGDKNGIIDDDSTGSGTVSNGTAGNNQLTGTPNTSGGIGTAKTSPSPEVSSKP